ncbi:MAG TPA: D-alanyl-D-alanine carboxypeptidase, partial [Phycisphaerales bacterium]|nr:D-alanyl-D-alanine carboxypeptidase [Phycisphaerales bacterium]
MPRIARSAIAAWIVLHTLATVSVASASGGLQAEVERAIRSTPLKNAVVGVSIRDADSRTSLVSVGASRPMIPASNMKLLTTGAAMHVLGADFHFTTRLLRDGDRLIVIGDGDPAFGDPTLLEMTTVDGQTGISVEQFLKL